MDNKLLVLHVRLFGKEKITYGSTPILYGRNSITKAMKLLLILLYSGKDGIPRNRLLEDLYGREELADAANNLRVTTHRLKKMLVEAGLPEFEYIVSDGGIYYWDSPMETIVDVNVFKELVKTVGSETNQEKKLNMLKEACRLYGGEFLQKLSGDEWVLMESVQCKNMYFDVLHQLCDMLMERREFDEVLRWVEPAIGMYPFDEWQAVKIDCYIAMNRYKDALKEYEATAKLLIDELAEGLHNAIKNSLRRCDSFTKYNRSQFLVMLVGTNEENCQIAIDRIVNNFVKEHKNWAGHLECSVSSLLDVEYQESGIHFRNMK